MMTKRVLLIVGLGMGLIGGATCMAEDTKTDPSHGIFVENTTTNFALVGNLTWSVNKYVAVFELSAPTAGDYTLVCAIDGKVWKEEKTFKIPGTFRLNTRGMVSGSHRITLQVVDADGGVGSWTKNIDVK
jgi:hypothetical protein